MQIVQFHRRPVVSGLGYLICGSATSSWSCCSLSSLRGWGSSSGAHGCVSCVGTLGSTVCHPLPHTSSAQQDSLSLCPRKLSTPDFMLTGTRCHKRSAAVLRKAIAGFLHSAMDRPHVMRGLSQEGLAFPRCQQTVLPLPVIFTQRCSAGVASSPQVFRGQGGCPGETVPPEILCSLTLRLPQGGVRLAIFAIPAEDLFLVVLLELALQLRVPRLLQDR